MSGGHSGHSPAVWSRPFEAVVLLLRGRTVRTAAPVAIVVGTVLSVVNQGHLVLGGEAGVMTWVRIGVNFLVPFLVASFGFLSARRVDGSDRCSSATAGSGDEPGATDDQ